MHSYGRLSGGTIATRLQLIVLLGTATTATEWQFRSNLDGFAVVGGAVASPEGLQFTGDGANGNAAPPASITWSGTPSTGDFTASLAYSGFRMHPPVRMSHRMRTQHVVRSTLT